MRVEEAHGPTAYASGRHAGAVGGAEIGNFQVHHAYRLVGSTNQKDSVRSVSDTLPDASEARGEHVEK